MHKVCIAFLYARYAVGHGVAKMQYYYDLFVVHGDPAHCYTDEDHEGFEEPMAFTVVVGGLAGRQLDRAQQLRALRPTKPM